LKSDNQEMTDIHRQTAHIGGFETASEEPETFRPDEKIVPSNSAKTVQQNR
jgi:hypothetical protein